MVPSRQQLLLPGQLMVGGRERDGGQLQLHRGVCGIGRGYVQLVPVGAMVSRGEREPRLPKQQQLTRRKQE